MTFALLFMIVALVMFGIAFFGVPSGRYDLIAGGLFFGTLSLVVNNIH